ncbi:MAG: hypothetical protein ACKVS6_05485 [Planctomycetota bacterium]
MNAAPVAVLNRDFVGHSLSVGWWTAGLKRMDQSVLRCYNSVDMFYLYTQLFNSHRVANARDL